MNPVVYIIAAFVVAIILWFLTHGGNNAIEVDESVQETETQQASQAGVRRRRNARMGIRQHAASKSGKNEYIFVVTVMLQDYGIRQGCDLGEDSDKEQSFNKDGKIGTKKLKKLQEKEERRKQRVQDALDREQERKEQEERDQIHAEEEEKKKQEEERIAEKIKREEEEKERREHEEYLKLKAMFSVDEEGQQEITNDEQSQNQLQQFVQYIKQKKVVLLEDLGSHFGLRTQDAINRVQTMLKDEILTGVIDDRGKFIYISHEELEAVAMYIDHCGRVSINDLAHASNSLINLISEEIPVSI